MNDRPKTKSITRYDEEISQKLQRDEVAREQKKFVSYLRDRYGDNFFTHQSPADGCHRTPPIENVIDSEEELNSLVEKYDKAYQLTRENLGKHLSGLNRRNFLKMTGAFLAASAVPLSARATGESGVSLDSQGGAVPGPEDTALVSMVRSDSVETSVRRAVEKAGGLDEIQQGESVVIKPNCVWRTGKQAFLYPDAPDAPVTTNPEVLRAVIRVVKERNQAPDKIFLADHGAYLASTMNVFIEQGMYDVAMEENINVLPWEETEHEPFSSEKFEYLQHPVSISKTLNSFDHFINVPVLKNHELNVYPLPLHQAQFSCCLKAFVGVIHAKDCLFNKRMFHEVHLPQKIAELNLCRPYRMPNGKPGITMNIVDATSIIVQGGPHNSIYLQEMKVEYPDIVLASKDRVACDAAAVSVLKHYGIHRVKWLKNYIRKPVWDQLQIVHAGHLGLGINDRDRIEVVTEGIDEDELASIEKLFRHTDPITVFNKRNYI